MNAMNIRDASNCSGKQASNSMNGMNIKDARKANIRDDINCSHASTSRKARYVMNAVYTTDASNNRNASNIT